MNTRATITILTDNTATSRDTQGEHGLAFWIDTRENCLLFDTGQGLVLANNAHALRIDMDAVDAIILSHGHYDHTGGLADVLHAAAGPVAVHTNPDALLPKYRRTEAGVRDIGMPAGCRAVLLSDHCRLIPSRQAKEIVPGIWATGEIPRRHPEEATTESFCRDPEGHEEDPLRDDQALFIETAQGIIVLLGCAHAGIVNTLDHIQTLTGNKPIRAVLGGMHLRSAPEARVAWTLRQLHRFTLKLLVPMHCTGPKATAALWAAFPHACQAGSVGTIFTF